MSRYFCWWYVILKRFAGGHFMRTTLFVISDLHLGGSPGDNGRLGFQICPVATQQQLASFLDGLPERSGDHDVRLVLAGDIVDFLAEEPFRAFTDDPRQAHAKLESILQSTAPFWEALKRFVEERDGAATLMLGNHDIELALPGTRQLLLDNVGDGRVDFLYDNEAFSHGKVLIEHGNRFDEWNAVPHGAFRRARSQLSRGRAIQPEFPGLPGSQLVVDVMNQLKKDYAFVDLLKPENAGALPVLAALGAPRLRDAWKFFQKFRQTWSVDYDEEREPTDDEYIGAGDAADQRMFDLAEDIAQGGDATQVGSIGKAVVREALLVAFERTLDQHADAFDVGKESAKYLVPARAAAKSGFQVVVYGHTHLAKRIRLGSHDAPTPVYLNTGTWADLMGVPPAVWGADRNTARSALGAFVDDLAANRLDRWRRSVPTFARIELDGDVVTSADVYFADAPNEPVTTEGLKRRLSGGASNV
jgi:UDP-2,3-diacylglucosamine pyrophosphatase LpxH